MTLYEYINAYRYCAINDVPCADVETLVETVPFHPDYRAALKPIVKYANDNPCGVIGLRFSEGKLSGHITVRPYTKSFSLVPLDRIISYTDLRDEEERCDDFTFVLDLC